TIASTAAAGDRTLNVMTSAGVSNAVTFTVTNNSSQAQMQRLIGTWVFSYFNFGQSNNTIRLSNVQESTTSPGTWLISGTYSGDPVAATYSSALGKYVLL